jgi:catechol 2,3-dioxygenase-like lactoylglutathione lyase family enzyme
MRVGHVQLKVSDLERALRLYRDVLGFELTQRYVNQAAFVSAGAKGVLPLLQSEEPFLSRELSD